MESNISAWRWALLMWAALFGVGPASAGDAPLGSPEFQASPEHPVGWRGNGSGAWPGATPPLSWGLTKDGEAKNLIWQTELPRDGTSSVISVGDRLFTTGNDFSLICADKKTGRLLWIRSVSPYDAATQEDRAANPDAFGPLDDLAKKRDAIAAKIPKVETGEIGKLGQELGKLDAEMMRLLGATDKAKYKATGMTYSDGGYMATTPASDGSHVYVWNGWGVTACFDLNGNRTWIRFDQLRPQEHGHYGSPLLVGDMVVIYLGWRYRALDKQTGKERWTSEYHQPPEAWMGYWYGSHLAARVGDEKVIVAGDGSLICAQDGRRFILGKAMQGTSPILCQNRIFWISRDSVNSYPLPASTAGKVEPVLLKYEFDFKASGFMSTSPLYHDGLVYIIGSKPQLSVYEAATGTLVYTKLLDLVDAPARNDRPYGCGICASPSFAGGKIFLITNFGTTIVIEPGRAYREIARNAIDRHIAHNYKNDMAEGTVSNPYFEGGLMYYRAQRFLYCIGETGK